MASIPGMDIVQNQIDSMSSRDRKLLTGLIIFASFVLVGLLAYTLKSALDTKASRVVDAKDKLETALVLQQDYLDASAKIEASEERLSQYTNQRLSPYLEQLAQKNSVSEELRKVEEVSTAEVGNIKQTTYKVELKKAPMANLYRFLHDMETSGYPLQVDNARFSVSYIKREKHLDLTMEVVVYTLTEEAG